ncbi:MAG: zf-HC2 domain-containing protein [Candidatus Acidiferrales bacterium]
MGFEYRSSACAEYEALLEDSVSGEIGGADAIRLSQHLKDCAGCREALEFVALSPRLLRLAEASADPGPGFARGVMARLRTDKDVRAERGFWQPLISLAWRFAATASLALAVLVAYDTTAHKNPEPAVAAIEASQLPDLFSPDPARVPTTRDEVMMMFAENEHGKH